MEQRRWSSEWLLLTHHFNGTTSALKHSASNLSLSTHPPPLSSPTSKFNKLPHLYGLDEEDEETADDWENGGVGGGGGGGNGDLEGEECDRLLAERDNGLDIALSRNKQWNRYCKDVLSYVRSRLNIEDEYAKKLQQLAAQWRPALKTTPFLPLSDVLEAGLTADQEHADATRATVEHLHERCVKVLEQRRAEHDATQRDIQKTHQKLLKALEDTQSELKRAQSSLQGREDGWKKARSSIQRHDDALSLSLAGFNSSHASSSFGAGSSSSSSASLLSEATRRRKEAERRRRQEEDAHTKCEEASRLVATLEHDLAAHRRALHLNKTKSISSLRELVYRCDQTTKACTQHYFKALGATGTQRPSAWTTLASTCRSYKPGAAYMSYVRQLPPTTATAAAASNNATTATSSTTSSSSDAARLVGGAGLPPALSTSSVASTSSAVFSMAAGSSASAATNSRRTTTTTTTTDALLGGGGGSYASSTAALHSDSAGFQNGRHPALASASAASTSLASQRRNAVQAEEHLLPAGLGPSLKLHRRAQKKNSGPSRLSSLGGGGDDERKWVNVDKSEAARTHRAVRIRQPVKCNDCETLSLLNTYQCRDCTLVWHRNCLIRTSQRCPCPSSSGSSTTTDPSSSSSTSVAAAKSWPSGATLSAASAAAASARRTSIFGVSLAGHLAEQKRVVPLILETTVEQLHRHGMRIKGIYRLCGVKSKIEAICEEFERHRNAQGSTALQNSIHLDAVSPVNLASVVKLYLRKLPDPLLTHELYDEWLRVAERLPLVRASTSTADEMSDEMKVATTLRPIIGRLPRVNHETLKLVALHLNRVTWYKHDNLMDSANLAAVVTPSLIWPPSSRSKTALVHAHSLAAVVERIIRHAHILFNVDKSEDRARFEEQFPETASPSVSESVDVLLLLPSGAAPPTNGDPALSDELCRTTLVVGDEDDDDIDGLDDEEEDEDEEFSLPDIVKPIGATTATDDTAGDDAATLRRVQPTQPQQQQQLLCATAAATEDDSSGTSGLGSSERTSHQQPPSQQQQHHHHPHSQRASSVASWTSSALRHSTAFDQSHDSADGSSNNNNGQEVAATVADRRYTTSIPITDDVSLCSIDSTGLLVDESSAPAIARSSVSSRLPLRRRCSAQKSSASRSDTQDSSTTAADTATSSPAPSQQHPDQDDVSYV